MSAKHTPGPWTLHREHDSKFWVTGDYRPKDDSSVEIAAFIHDEANARLIAAAPEMLATLKFALEQIEPASKPNLIRTPEFALTLIRDAIAKAEGKS